MALIYDADGNEYGADKHIRAIVVINILLTETDQIAFNWDEETAQKLRAKSHTWRNRFKRGMLKAMEQSLNKKLAPHEL